MHPYRALLCLAPLALACAQEATGPGPLPVLADPPPIPSTTPSFAVVGLTGLPTTVLVGQRFQLSALADHGHVVTDRRVTWEISDPDVAILVPGSSVAASGTTKVFATGGGIATVTARMGETSTRLSLRVVGGPTPISTAVEIESLSLTVFQYPTTGVAGRWYYAPQIRVKGATGSARIVGLHWTIPGMGETGLCTTDRAVALGEGVDLFREMDGDYEVAYELDGSPDVSSAATGVVYVVGSDGVVGHVDINTRPVLGHPPTGITGVRTTSRWSC